MSDMDYDFDDNYTHSTLDMRYFMAIFNVEYFDQETQRNKFKILSGDIMPLAYFEKHIDKIKERYDSQNWYIKQISVLIGEANFSTEWSNIRNDLAIPWRRKQVILAIRRPDIKETLLFVDEGYNAKTFTK